MQDYAGQRNKLLTIQRKTSVSDGQGGTTDTWATLGQEWGLVEPVNNREAILAQQLSAVMPSAVTIPFRTPLSVKDRLTFENRTLAIESIQDPDGKRRALKLICSEVLA